MPVAAPRPRLSPDDWIAAGFRALAGEGPAGIRVEAIARDLAATKGSFYWHFRDVGELRTAMLTAWEAQAQAAFARIEGPDLPPRRRLMLWVDLAAAGEGLEPAVRAWALVDPAAHEAVARLDGARARALRGWFAAVGLGAAAAARAALTVQAAAIGLDALARSAGAEVRRDLAALVRGLIEGRA